MKGQKLIPLLVVAAGLLAYHNSFTGTFVRDDGRWIQDNPRIRQASLFKAASGTSRPVVQLSLALNYAVGGLDVRGYHAFNLVVHVLAGLTLYGIVRRTLSGERLRSRYGQAAGGLALAVAVLWLVHPLQTESVTYIIQRCESLMGLFYLLTLYCVIRGAESANGRWWYGAAVIACALGMGSKPVMVTAPLMVLLYDRAFLTDSFHEAWRRRVWLYSGLVATWLLLPVLLRNGSAEWKTDAGFGSQAVRPLEYVLTQPGVILYYLRLCVWPHPLSLNHPWPIANTWMRVLPPTVVIAILVGATAWAWKGNPAPLRAGPVWGFVGAWFFLILAPSSSFIPLHDLMYEHRMYLPLAAVVGLVVLGLYSLAGRHSLAVFVVVAIGLGYLTWQRNQNYRNEVTLWLDTVAKFPNEPLQHYNLGIVLSQVGKFQEAIEQFEQTLRLDPNLVGAHNNLGIALAQLGRIPEAVEHFQQALRIEPAFAEAHHNLGVALEQAGKLKEAIGQFEQALRISPDLAEAHNDLAIAFVQLNKLPEAVGHFEQALRLKPDYAEAHYSLGVALEQVGRVQEALVHYEQALRIRPDYAEAHGNLGGALFQAGNVPEAIGHWEQALRIKPNYAEAHYNWGVALMGLGQVPEAIAHWEQALRIKPDYAEAHNNLGVALAQLGRVSEATGHWEQALRIKPGCADAHYNLAVVLQQAGKVQEAKEHYEQALRINPQMVGAQNGLARLRTAQ